MYYTNFVILCALISAAKAAYIGLDTDSQGKIFRFFNYKNRYCITTYGDSVIVGDDCSDSNAFFSLVAQPSSYNDNGILYDYTVIKFQHVATGKCLDHDISGNLGLYECQACCNSALSQEWIKKNSWSQESYYMINANSAWSSCMTANQGTLSIGTPIFLRNCDYYDNSQWWQLWQVV